MLFVNKQKQIQEKIASYNQQVLICMDEFQEAVKGYCKSPDREALREGEKRVHKAEGLADDIRRDVEVLMYTKALFPESRGDILGLIETMDKVPNHTESSIRMILHQHILISDEFSSQFLELVDITCSCVKEMIHGVNCLFENFFTATIYVGKVDELESQADRAEANLIDRIFSSSLEGIHKILLRDLARHIAGITDRAENVGDRIRIIVAKRKG